MPPERTLPNKKRLERETLSRRIKRCGFEMSPACSTCEQHSRKCIVLPQDSGRCSECVWRGFKCDATGVPESDWSALEREEQRIRQEKKETLAKLLRLERQEEFLRERGMKMLRRGLKTLDELDEVEEKERKEKEEAERREREGRPTAPSGDVSGDPFPDPFEGYSGAAFGADLPLSPSSWDISEFVGGTASGGQGS